MNSRKTIRYTMEDVAPAVAMLQKGGLVALPTETVYGLAVNAENSAAVWVLYEVKQREREKALSVLVTGMEMVENYCQNIPAPGLCPGGALLAGAPDHDFRGQRGGLCPGQ